MQHILREGDHTIHFQRYSEALALYRTQLPPEVAAFAGDAERYVLNHAKSLHDAWVQSITVTDSRATQQYQSGVAVEIVLLGQMHDRHIILSYADVARYQIYGLADSLSPTSHGDLHTHEVRVSAEGRVVHEIVFVAGSCIEIECRTFTVQDRLLR